jgi:hypothetical protein
MQEFDLRKAALNAASLAVSVEARTAGIPLDTTVPDRVRAVATEFAEWLREGVRLDEETFRADLADLESTALTIAPETGVQRLHGTARPMTPEEVWGTDVCEGCGHLTSVHTLDGQCFADSECRCKGNAPVVETAPDTDASEGENGEVAA